MGKRLHGRGCLRPRTPLKRREEAAEYIQNAYYTEGYRACTGHRDALRSLFYWHVDWLDTWTSIIDVFHSTALLLYAMYCTEVWSEGATVDRVVFWTFYAVSWLHAPASVMYHLFGCAGITKEHFLFYQRLDYIMIFCSSVPLACCLGFYVFHVQPWPLLFSVVGVVASLTHAAYKLKEDLTAAQRVNQMAVLVFFYVVPLLWQAGRDVWQLDFAQPTLWYALAALASLGFGAYCYGVQWPQSVRTDSHVTGHALMHVGVNLAYFFEFCFILAAFRRATAGGYADGGWQAFSDGDAAGIGVGADASFLSRVYAAMHPAAWYGVDGAPVSA